MVELMPALQTVFIAQLGKTSVFLVWYMETTDQHTLLETRPRSLTCHLYLFIYFKYGFCWDRAAKAKMSAREEDNRTSLGELLYGGSQTCWRRRTWLITCFAVTERQIKVSAGWVAANKDYSRCGATFPAIDSFSLTPADMWHWHNLNVLLAMWGNNLTNRAEERPDFQTHPLLRFC